MPQPRFDATKTIVLAELREQLGLTQQYVATEIFGLRDRGSIRAWEVGTSSPPEKHRTSLLVYLLDHLKLRSDPPRFYQLWDEVMVHTWGWEPLSLDEQSRYLPHALPASLQTRPLQQIAPFLAPPRPTYPVVGRAATVAELRKRLLSLEHTVLCGLPGAGKTALAIELANDRTVLAAFQDGVLWARLGQRANVFEELGKWLLALDVPISELRLYATEAARVEAIHQRIGLRRMLLVVDDVWDMADALNFVVGGPNTVRLITTRSPEIAADLANGATMRITELAETDGLALLEKVAPRTVQREKVKAEALVRAVGGLPLALLLLGNQLRLAEQQQHAPDANRVIGDLLDAQQRLTLATAQTPLHRHPSLSNQTQLSLRAAIELSVNALSKESQQMLQTLALAPAKPNTFSEAAALATTDGQRHELISLVNSGLVEKQDADRYTIHATIVDYMHGLLPTQVTVGKFIEYYVQLLDTQQREYALISAEYTNILAALTLAEEQANPLFVRGVNALYDFAETQGYYPTIQALLERAVPLAIQVRDIDGQAAALFHLSMITSQRGEYPEAEAYANAGLQLAKQVNNKVTLLAAQRNLGRLALVRGDYARSRQILEEGIAVARMLALDDMIVAYLNDLGNVAQHQSQFAEAQAYYLAGLERAKRANLVERACGLLNNLAQHLLNQGVTEGVAQYLEEGLLLARTANHQLLQCLLLLNYGELAKATEQTKSAIEFLDKALVIARHLESQELLSTTLQSLGAACMATGEQTAAEAYLGEALTIAEAINHPFYICRTHIELGTLALNCVQREIGTAHFQQALDLARQIDSQPEIFQALFGLAQITYAEGNVERATHLGRESLVVAEKIQHKQMSTIQQWLRQHHLS